MHSRDFPHGLLRRLLPSIPRSWLVVPAIIAIAVTVTCELTDVDRIAVRFFYDAATASFPLRESFWLDVVMHHWAKYAVAALVCVAVAGYAITFFRTTLRPARRSLLFLALAMTLAPLSVTAGKAASSRHCPWDLADFGGSVPYATLLQPTARDAPRGHCFPAGHASSGFALLAFYFIAHARRRRRAAQWALALGLAAGTVLGTGRVAQGAHFPSHVVWSGLFCWTVMVGLYFALLRKAGPQREPASDLPVHSRQPGAGVEA